MRASYGSLIVWLAIQLFTLAIGAMRVPLAARSGSEPQHLALAEMIVVQLAAGTLLFPLLLRRDIAIAALISTLPFQQLAAWITAVPIVPQIAVSAAVVLWLVGLCVWLATVRSTRNQLIIVATLNVVVIGAPVMTYLVREFADSQEQAVWRLPAAFDPVDMIVIQSSRATFSADSLSASAGLVASGAAGYAFRRRKTLLAKLST